MNREATIKRLCKLVTDVGEAFDHHYASDCFCVESEGVCGTANNAVVEYALIEWIERVVYEAIDERKKSLTCPHCGYVRKLDDYKSWCEEHDECLCPECGMCPKADGQALTHREQEEERILIAVRKALREEMGK